MTPRIFAALAVAVLFAIPVYANAPSAKGRDLLVASDRALYPAEGSFTGKILVTDEDGGRKTYAIQCFKKGGKSVSLVFTSPSIMKDDAGIRSGDTIYFQAKKETRPVIQSYQANFVESAFSWGDMTSADLAEDYAVTNLAEISRDGKKAWMLVLKPLKAGMYARIDVYVDRETRLPVARDYYTASGELMKKASYRDYQGSPVNAFTVSVEHLLQGVKTELAIQNVRAESLPKSWFDPNAIGRLRSR